ncbi:hypothetical protein C0J52_01517 [Blattella germanica]|nr:hypothetical protein C0J52_01517 [Blattella germanica]
MEFCESDESVSSLSSISSLYSYSIESQDSSDDSYPNLPSKTTLNKKKGRKRTPQILDKLYYRELRGNFSPHPHSSNLKLFCQIPSRCQIRLRNVLPESAIDSNHVFLGLSRCGQFLLSYTFTTELDVMSLNEVYKYRLHWWAFVPHQKVRKVSEVMLFGNQGIYSTLYIAVCQWPMDHSRVLIYGNCQESYGQLPGTWATPPPERSYLTVTTVPSLNKCPDCLRVAASYEEEEIAAGWDTCVRFSCLKHGLTVHTSFDVVSPFPKFEPSICMKREGSVVFNTGNFLHVLKVELEHLSNISSTAKSCTTNSVIASDASETIDQNPLSVDSTVSESAGPIKQDLSLSGKDDSLKLDDSETDISETQTLCQMSKIYDTRLHRKQIGLLQHNLSPSPSHETSGDMAPSKQDDTRIGASRNYSSTTSETERFAYKNRLAHAIEDDFEDDIDDIGASDDVISNSQIFLASNGKRNCSEQDLDKVVISRYGSDENISRLGSDIKFINKDTMKSSEISASEFKVSRLVLRSNGKCTGSESDSKKVLDSSTTNYPAKEAFEKTRSDTKTDHYTKDLEALTIKERGKEVRDSFIGRITRSHSSRVSNLVEAENSSSLDEDHKTDSEKVRKNECLQTSSIGEKCSRFLNGDIWKEQRDCNGISNKESRIMDSTQELNITCGNMNATTSEEMISVVTLMSPVPGTLLMVNSADESENGECQSPYERRKEATVPTSSRARRIRGGATVKLSSPLPAMPATPLLNSAANNIHSKIAEAEKAYEFTDEGLEPGCEKLSSFRRRRLADKKYEFCEEGEDAENIVPFRLTRRREMSPRLKSPPLYLPSSPIVVSHRRRHHDALSEPPELIISGPRSPQILANDIHPITQSPNLLEADKVVLRPLNRNTAAVLLSPRDRDSSGDWVKNNTPGAAPPAMNSNNNKKLNVPDSVALTEFGSCDKLDNGVQPMGIRMAKKEVSSPSSNSGNTNTTRCTVQLKRRYIEVDDELVSVITDIEGNKYYIMAPCVLVHQRSFDVEQFCHEIAERLCVEAGKKYWFCNDYDVCPFSGDVIAVALMRIQATIKTKGLAKSQRHPVSSMERQQYQGSCKFVWNVDTGHYAVVWTRALHKVDPNDADVDPWNPARELAMKLRNNLHNVPMCQTVKTISNELVLRGKIYFRHVSFCVFN